MFKKPAMGGELRFDRRQVLSLGAGAALTSMVGGWARAAIDATAVTPVVKTSNGPIVGYVTDGIKLFAACATARRRWARCASCRRENRILGRVRQHACIISTPRCS
jgi:hypothetical protein